MSDTDKKKHILLIEDDHEIAGFIETELICEGYQVSVALDGFSGMAMANNNAPDLILLDLMLPGLDGLSICRRLRQKQNDVPIIMLTALRETSDKVKGLTEGANDYLVKPFDLEELLARILVQFRLRNPEPPSILEIAGITMDLERHEVWHGEHQLNLTLREFELLHLFLQYPNITLSRQKIVTTVWGWDCGKQDNVLEVYIGYLRRKLEQSEAPRLIHTVRGVGYIFKTSL